MLTHASVMEGQQQLLSEEVAQNSECAGIEAPDLIQQDITADEEDTTQDNLKLNDAQVVSNNEVSSTERKECEETPDGEIEARAKLQENKTEEETSPNDGEDKRTENNDKETPVNMLPDESSAVEGGNDTNDQTSSEMNSSEKDDSGKTQNTTEEKANDKEENINTKTDDTANENKKSNGNHCAEVVVDDGNNNVEDTEGGKNKDSVRRTRFSSEVTIQPKAYFQAGAETVVMMPPGSSSDDVFKNDSTSNSTSSSAHAVVNVQPSDSVLPRTFLPLTLFTCLFCPMIGLFAVYKSYSVKQFIKKGDIRKANEASQHARQLGVLTLCIGFFFVLAIVVIAVLVSTLT